MTIDSRFRVLQLLSDGQTHTGTALAGDLGISRAAVWKHIQSLREEGFGVDAVAGKGYQLEHPITLLDGSAIKNHLDAHLKKAPLHIAWKVESTNDWLKLETANGLDQGSTCLAEQQTAGRGTKGRPWVSPPGINLYLSFYWSFDRAPSELNGLSLAVAISIIDRLAELDFNTLMVKWPNDIYTRRGKLGGILIDMFAETNGPTRVIIGVGLNCGMTSDLSKEIEQPIDDLSWQKDGRDVDRNQLAAMIINALSECCKTYESDGFSGFRQRWLDKDMVRDKVVILQTEKGNIEGVALGVDERGALVLSSQGDVRHYVSGEITLKVKS